MAEGAIQVRPFSNGSEYAHWDHNNCARCQRVDSCPLSLALGRAYFGDGTIPADVATEYGGTVGEGEDAGWVELPAVCPQRTLPPAGAR